MFAWVPAIGNGWDHCCQFVADALNICVHSMPGSSVKRSNARRPVMPPSVYTQ